MPILNQNLSGFIWITGKSRDLSIGVGYWDWGLSALRLSVQYGQQSAIGKLNGALNGSATMAAVTLWWQAPQHQVQF
jgi:hypothetical protein